MMETKKIKDTNLLFDQFKSNSYNTVNWVIINTVLENSKKKRRTFNLDGTFKKKN